ncbi:SPW repeat protein [Streptomyces sp. NPDC051320]|uniref:SPW repeat protein n=1 Tax=Streptomyces sp. NPDC051320 TaxID=3154644 RepID=UPI003437414A
MHQHPDIMALREHSEQAAVSPAAQGVEALSVLSGLYLAASPWIVGFNGFSTLTVNNLITGLALTVLAVGFGSAYERTHGMSWAAAGIGAWTIIAPWAVAGNVDTTSTIVSNVIVGAVALVCALTMAGMGATRRR